MTDQTSTPAPSAPETPAAAPVRRSFFKSTLGRVTLVGGVLVALGAGVAVAQQGWRHGGMMGGQGMMGGGRGLERFCAADLSWVTQRMAEGVATRLNLTDAQKPALADLRATALRVGGEAKKLCAEKRDMATVPGRLAAASQGLAMANMAMGELKPKIEAFYATLTDEQKKQMDQMGPRGRRGGGMGPGMMGPGQGGQGGPGMGHRGWRQGESGDGAGPRGWRQGEGREGMRGPGWRQGGEGQDGQGWRQREGGPGWRQGMMQQGERPAAQRDWN